MERSTNPVTPQERQELVKILWRDVVGDAGRRPDVIAKELMDTVVGESWRGAFCDLCQGGVFKPANAQECNIWFSLYGLLLEAEKPPNFNIFLLKPVILMYRRAIAKVLLNYINVCGNADRAEVFRSGSGMRFLANMVNCEDDYGAPDSVARRAEDILCKLHGIRKKK